MRAGRLAGRGTASMASLRERVENIQRHLGLQADGIVGPDTLTALENALGLAPPAPVPLDAATAHLTVSRRGLDQIVEHEISSPTHYRRALQRPTFPGGDSGVTIGIGYDLGANSASQIRRDWQGLLADTDVEALAAAAGLKGEAAQRVLPLLQDIQVPLAAAEQVFYTRTLPRYAQSTRRAYPAVQLLAPDAQAALLSLVYNRGSALSGASRSEMRAIVPLVAAQDYAGIAEQLRAMKRLWVGEGLDGLLARRDAEATLVENAQRAYQAAELVRV